MTKKPEYLSESDWLLVPVYKDQPGLVKKLRSLFKDMKMLGNDYPKNVRDQTREVVINDVAHDFLQWESDPTNFPVDREAIKNLVKLAFHWHFTNSRKPLSKTLSKAERDLAGSLFRFWQREMETLPRRNDGH